MPEQGERERRPLWAWIALAAAFALVALYTLTGLSAPFGQGDEILYAQKVREMIASGDYYALRWQDTVLLERPSLPFVLAAGSHGVFGGEVGLRLPSALFSLLTVGAVGAAIYAHSRSIVAATAAGLLLATVPSFHDFSRALWSDPSFVFGTTVALAGTLWAISDARGLVVAALGAGFAVACKSLAAGPVLVALLPFWVLAARARGSRRQVVISIAGFAVLALPFFVVGVVRYGGAFFELHLGRTLLARATGDAAVGMDSSAGYAGYIVTIDGPLVALWIAGAVVGCAVLWWRSRDRGLLLCALFCAVVFGFFSLFGTQLPHYILPLYPGAAIAVGLVVARVASRERWQAMALAGSIVVAAVGLPRSAEFHLLPQPEAAELGQRIAAADGVPPGPVFTLDYYGPSVAHYAGRRWKIAAAAPELYAVLSKYFVLARAGVVDKTPPWPDQPFLLAGFKDQIESRPDLELLRQVAVRGPLAAVIARARPGVNDRARGR